MPTADRVAAVWLLLAGLLLGCLLTILALAPRDEVAGAPDLAPPARSLAEHCTPESGWPCER